MKEIVFATNNPNKLREIKQIAGKDIKILSLKDIGCNEEIPEEQDTIEGNARQKAFYIYNKYKKNCFADDTGLMIDALDGRPGVLSARYAGEASKSEDNIKKILSELSQTKNRKAQFKTVISLVIEGKEEQFTGIVKGEISRQKSGKDGFGYDPVFIPENYNITFSEMDADEKNKISHRGKATKKLTNYLKKIK